LRRGTVDFIVVIGMAGIGIRGIADPMRFDIRRLFVAALDDRPMADFIDLRRQPLPDSPTPEHGTVGTVVFLDQATAWLRPGA
jgi:hypothetical protein